uniref:CFA20 domain-containing protein n=1 Tax=Glycine max TaxID=3847 RepID=A0A0R0H2W7_SOYBN
MFKNTFQSGFLSILYSLGSKPLQIWTKKVLENTTHWEYQVTSISEHQSPANLKKTTYPIAQRLFAMRRWFAKRFLHPDIVSIYDYIFLWDEDLGVEHFSPSSSKPLQIWDKEVMAVKGRKSGVLVQFHTVIAVKVVNGHVERPQDEDIQSNVLEIIGSNIQSTYITCPADPAATLGIKLPFLVLIVKNLMKYFTFEIQVLDDKNVRRRFRASNFQFNLADFTKRAYGTNYVETLQVQVHANCRLRRIYFSDRLYSEEELPPEFKLYLPMQNSTTRWSTMMFEIVARKKE